MLNSRPLVVDLDGTLIRSDMLLESGVAFVRDHPLRLFSTLSWLRSGRTVLKARLAAHTRVDVSLLPYEPEVLDAIAVAREEGREVVLATASDEKYAREIAEHLGCFDRIHATTEHTENLKAGNKAALLVKEYGEGGFDYLGNSRADLPVWALAHRAYAVNPDPGVMGQARSRGLDVTTLVSSPHPVLELLRAMRCHQWVKNTLLFVPLLAGHQATDVSLLVLGVLAFICFGLCSSSVYLLNDLFDLQDDRRHPRKKQRPFAAGTLPLGLGLAALPLCLVGSFLLALVFLPHAFLLALCCYYLLTLAYSLLLKRKVIVDVIVLAGLYTLRLIAGTLVFDTLLTFWLLAFSMFIFLSLALLKRCAELGMAKQSGELGKTPGRGYFPDDLPVLYSMGIAAGYLSVLVLALYIQDEQTTVLYGTPQLIWLACPLLLFWISRVWLITRRGGMDDDPVVFAFKDPVSLMTGLLFGFVFWAAI